MRFLHPERDAALELTLDEVFLVPGYFDGTSRSEVDLTPVDFPGGSHPIVSANMNAVTGKRMAETMARFGGWACSRRTWSCRPSSGSCGTSRRRTPATTRP